MSPDTTIGELDPLFCAPPGEATAVYVTGSPPVLPGVKATETCVEPRVPTTEVGAEGDVAGVTVAAAEAGDVPTLLLFVSVHVYCTKAQQAMNERTTRHEWTDRKLKQETALCSPGFRWSIP